MLRWTTVIGIGFCAVAVERLLLSLSMALGPGLVALLFLLVLAEGAGALLAGLGLLWRHRIALLGLLVFAVAATAHMGADVGVYGVRSLLEALSWALMALALAALGWIAFRHDEPARTRPIPV